MAERTISNNRLIDGAKLDNTPSDVNAELLLKVDKVSGKGLSTNDFTDVEQTKLGIAEITTNKGIINGYASLDGTGKIPISQIPALIGTGDMQKAVYDTNDNGIVDNAELVNGLTVGTAVPVGAVFTDTTYTDSEIKTKYESNADTNAFTDAEKTKLSTGVVDNTTAQTVAGIKTFISSPVVPTPTLGTQVVNKDYVDSIGGGSDILYVSGVVSLTADVGFTVTHNLGITQADVQNGKYFAKVVYNFGGSGPGITGSGGGEMISNTTNNTQAYWSASTPATYTYNHFQANTLTIKPQATASTCRIIITKNY